MKTTVSVLILHHSTRLTQLVRYNFHFLDVNNENLWAHHIKSVNLIYYSPRTGKPHLYASSMSRRFALGSQQPRPE